MGGEKKGEENEPRRQGAPQDGAGRPGDNQAGEGGLGVASRGGGGGRPPPPVSGAGAGGSGRGCGSTSPATWRPVRYQSPAKPRCRMARVCARSPPPESTSWSAAAARLSPA